jgi:hypothetical protein
MTDSRSKGSSAQTADHLLIYAEISIAGPSIATFTKGYTARMTNGAWKVTTKVPIESADPWYWDHQMGTLMPPSSTRGKPVTFRPDPSGPIYEDGCWRYHDPASNTDVWLKSTDAANPPVILTSGVTRYVSGQNEASMGAASRSGAGSEWAHKQKRMEGDWRQVLFVPE